MFWHHRDVRESDFLHENTHNYIIYNIVLALFLGDVNLDRENEFEMKNENFLFLWNILLAWQDNSY